METNDANIRYSGAPWFNTVSHKSIAVLGVGGIGSWASLLAARLSPQRLDLYDFDEVDTVNLGGQLYRTFDIGRKKVDAAKMIINDFSPYVYTNVWISIVNETNTFAGSHVVISCFDNMEARKTVFNTINNKIESSGGTYCPELFIDGRLNAEEFEVYAVNLKNKAERDLYQTTLFSDSESASPICSYKQTSFAASMIAAVITNLIVNFYSKQETNHNLADRLQRYRPFRVYYNAVTMTFKTELCNEILRNNQ